MSFFISSADSPEFDRLTQPLSRSSNALPLLLYLTIAVFFMIFFSIAYYLFHRWRDKIRNSVPLHVVTFPEIAAIVSLIAFFIYLLDFFGIDFVRSYIFRDSNDAWDLDERSPSNLCCSNAISSPEPIVSAIFTFEDEEIVESVIEGSLAFYSLEPKLGDCRRGASIRCKALQRMIGRSLAGLPLDGFDYDSILGQCCIMPVGYVQIPVGIVGLMMLDGFEYSVPMVTTEGCLVASMNRGCKAIHASGGATSVLLRDGMTRAHVVRFNSAWSSPWSRTNLTAVASKEARRSWPVCGADERRRKKDDGHEYDYGYGLWIGIWREEGRGREDGG